MTAIVLGTIAFVLIYVLLLPPSPMLRRLGRWQILGPLAMLPVIAIALLAGRRAGVVCRALRLLRRGGRDAPRAARAAVVIVVTAVGVSATAIVLGANSSLIGSLAVTILAIGAMMAAFARKIAANRELHEAREELAELAVSEERLRIARDMHDLLGHSLSVIALKSELAARLLEQRSRRERPVSSRTSRPSRDRRSPRCARPCRATAVRRSPTRSSGHARRSRAAGIDCELDGTPVGLPADVESVLAWAVREGTTNVVRHSGAQHCSIRVRAEGSRAAVEVEDNGQGDHGAAVAGSGLTGLAERAAGMRGTLEAGARPEGGFRLRSERTPGPRVIRVLIAEDQAMVRGALASLLALEGDIEVVAEVERGDAVLDAARRSAARRRAARHRDARASTGSRPAPSSSRELPQTRVLILTTFGRPGYLRRALEQGASGFLLKDAPARELAAAIREVAAGSASGRPGARGRGARRGDEPADRCARRRCSPPPPGMTARPTSRRPSTSRRGPCGTT